MKAKKLFEYKLKGERNISSRRPLLIGNRLFVSFIFDKSGFVASKVICLNTDSFEQLWEYDYAYVINNLLVSSNQTVLVCSMGGKMMELNPKNGELMQTHEFEMDGNGASSQIVNNKVVVGGVQRTSVTNCYDLSSTQLKWSFDNGGHSYRPLIHDNKVFQCTERHINCLDFETGEPIWKATEERTYIFNPVAIDQIIIAAGHGLLNFYDSQNGELLHQIETGIRESIREIVVMDNFIYFGDSSGKCYCFKITSTPQVSSELIWEQQTDGGIESAPAFFKEDILFINDNKKLLSLNRVSGELNWTFNTKGEAGISGILVDGEDIYLSVGKGFAYKINEV